MQTYSSRRPLSSPTQGPIATCISTLRELAPGAKVLHRALRDASRHIARIDDPRRDTLKSEWSTYTKRYKSIVDDTDVAAGKLAAVINVYLALQANTREGQEASMITELSTLQSELDGYNYVFSGPCANLRSNVETFYLKLVDPTGDRREHERAALFTAPLDIHSENTSQPQESQPEVTVSSVTSVGQCLWRMWGLLTERLPTFYATPSLQSPTTVENSLTHAQATAVNVFAQAGQDHTHILHRQHTDGATSPIHSSTRTLVASEKPVVDVVIASIKDILLSLGTQGPQLGVFRELTLHLKNEIKAYLQVLQSANAFPTPEKRIALANMQGRVARSSAHWRTCASALTDGYSRIQK